MNMRGYGRLAASLVILVLAAGCAVSAAGGQRRAEAASPDVSSDLGPEMTEFMTFLDAELAELTHLHDVGEVPAADFRVSRDRLAATREAAIRIARARNDDRVPDLYVLVDRELTQILPSGAAAIRGKKAGDRVGDDFIFHGRIKRSVSFNILERTSGISRATPCRDDHWFVVNVSQGCALYPSVPCAVAHGSVSRMAHRRAFA